MSRLTLALLALLAAGAAMPIAPLVVGAFSEAEVGGTPAGWEKLQLGDVDETTYRLVQDGGITVVRAEADNAASGLVRRLDVEPAQHPRLRWRWKVDNVLAKGDYRRRDGDDYPARIYITFDYPVGDLSFGDRMKYRALKLLGYGDIPTRALNYIWANGEGVTETRSNAYTDWVKMVPVESGAEHVGTWREESRNIVEDYRTAFGEEPPAITGIAIMTDTDNTKGRAVAYYGDLVLEEE